MLKKIPFASVIIITAILAFTYYVVLSFFSIREITNYESQVESVSCDYQTRDSSINWYFNTENLNDSIPYYRYRKLKDSIDYAKNLRQGNNKAYGQDSYLFFMSHFGIASLTPWNETSISNPSSFKKDSSMKQLDSGVIVIQQLLSSNKINQKVADSMTNGNLQSYMKKMRLEDELHSSLKRKTYYALSGYRVENTDLPDPFYIDGDTYNLIYYKTDSTKKKNNTLNKYGFLKTKQIPVRFLKNDGNMEGKILIPVSQRKYDFINKYLPLGSGIYFFMMLFITVGLPSKIIINIAKGKAFIKQNILYLKIISTAIFFYGLIDTLTPYLFKYYFRKLIASDFVLVEPLWHKFTGNLFTFFLALVVFIIAKAFNKGSKLQQEQDLTV